MCNSPVIGGGSTTVDGPKNDGRSLAVVTGVFRSPCAVSTSFAPLLCESALPFPLSRIVIVGPPKLFAIRFDPLLSVPLLLLLLLLV